MVDDPKTCPKAQRDVEKEGSDLEHLSKSKEETGGRGPSSHGIHLRPKSGERKGQSHSPSEGISDMDHTLRGTEDLARSSVPRKVWSISEIPSDGL